MSDKKCLAAIVEDASKVRRDPPINRVFINDAIRKIREGEVKVPRYPNGFPSLKSTYDVAASLQSSSVETAH